MNRVLWAGAAWLLLLSAGCGSRAPAVQGTAHHTVTPVDASTAVAKDAATTPLASAAPVATDFLVRLTAGQGSDGGVCDRAKAALLQSFTSEENFWLAVHCMVQAAGMDTEAARTVAGEAVAFHDAHKDMFLAIKSHQVTTNCVDKQLLDAQGIRVPNVGGIELFVRDPDLLARLTKQTCHLGSGSYRGFCFPWQSQNGHSDVTRTVCGMLKVGNIEISPAAVNVLADASQDPDFYAWDDMRAHAQTPDDAGVPNSIDTAKQDFIKFVRELFGEAAGACALKTDRGTRDSLYWAGYALHAVQDLASHRGRTNPEHSYNSKVEDKNPDKQQASADLARSMSAEVLRRLLKGRLSQCAPLWASYTGEQIGPAQKRSELKLEWDFTPSALQEYFDSWKKFEMVAQRMGAAARVRWFGKADEVSPKTCDWSGKAGPGAAADCGTIMRAVVSDGP